MQKHHAIDDLHSEERSVIALALVMGLLFAAASAMLLAFSGMPVPVHEALASLPASPRF